MAGAKIPIVILMCIVYVFQNPVFAQSGHDEIRGELLYSIHCISCHDSEVHWREKNLATNLRTLKEQVDRWQSNLALDWSNDDIMDVTYYLNKRYYHFPMILKNNLSENDQSLFNKVQ